MPSLIVAPISRREAAQHPEIKPYPVMPRFSSILADVVGNYESRVW